MLAVLIFGKSARAELESCRSTQGGYCVKIVGVAQASRGLEFLGIPADAKPGQVFEALYRFGLGLVGISAMVMIVLGGVMYMLAGDSKDRTTRGKNYITNAIWGLVLALVSWLILFTINPDLVGKFNLNLKPLNLKVEPINILRDARVPESIQKQREAANTEVFFDKTPSINDPSGISVPQQRRAAQAECQKQGGILRDLPLLPNQSSTVVFTCVKPKN